MLSTLIKILLSLVFAALIAGLYTLFNINLNDYKQDIESAVYDATGRRLQLEGNLEIAWSPTPSVLINQASFANAEWASAEHMATFEKFELGLALYPLLNKQIQITKILLEQPVITLETDSEGMANWQFGEQEPEQTEEASATMPSIIVNDLGIKQAKITYIDGVSGETTEFLIDTLELDISNLNDPFDVLFEAVYDQMPLSLSGQVGGLDALINNQLTAVDLAANISGVELNLLGEVASPHTGKGTAIQLQVATNDAVIAELANTEVPTFGDIELQGMITTDKESDLVTLDLQSLLEGLTLAVKGEIEQPQQAKGIALDVELITDSTSLSQLANAEIPPIGDLHLKGQLVGEAKEFSLTDLQLKAGESDLSGDINVSLVGDKPDVEAILHSNSINLAFLEAEEGDKATTEGEVEETKKERLFSDDPIVLTSLKQVDAKLSYTAGTISSAGLDMAEVKLDVDLVDGHLTVKPLTFAFAGSRLNSELDLNTGEEVAQLASKVQVNGFKLSKVAALSDTISGGNTDVYVQIKGDGSSVRELMAGLDGKAIVKVAESQIADGTLDILGADFFAELAGMLNPFSKEEKGTQLACAVVNFNINNGIATAKKGIAIQTGKLNIVGDGTVNLRNEEIDISIKPEPRTGIGVNISQLASLVKVGGTLANPGAEVDAGAVLTTGVTGAAAVATGGISVVAKGLIDRTTADQNPCETALNPKTKAE